MWAVTILALCAVVLCTPLDDYVNAPDPTYNFTVTTSIKGEGYTVWNLFLTSQTWMTAAESSKPVWTHWVQVCIPEFLMKTDVAVIYIDGGGSPDSPKNPPTKGDTLTTLLCATSRTVAVHISAIPDEPITFKGDWRHKSRSEDAIIAYTWSHFINDTNSPIWLLRLPMTKAVMRGMDAAASFVATRPNHPQITKWVVAGASKRGWTTWTVGAVDKRVIGIAPIVAPVGNLVPHINEMWRAYGEWSFALEDYTDMGIMHYLNDPMFSQIMDVVGPLTYKNRLTMPKLVICSCGDEFFMPDGINYMWNDLEGEKLLRMIPDAEHSLAGHQVDVMSTVQAWYLSLVEHRARPYVDWTISPDGTTITAKVLAAPGSAIIAPKKALVWRAYNSKKRDFRLIVCSDVKNPRCINPILWGPEELQDQGNYTYVAKLVAPETGWAAHFVELQFEIGGLSVIDPFKVSTGVSILPQTFPYPHCTPDVCGPTNRTSASSVY